LEAVSQSEDFGRIEIASSVRCMDARRTWEILVLCTFKKSSILERFG